MLEDAARFHLEESLKGIFGLSSLSRLKNSLHLTYETRGTFHSPK